MNATPPEDLLVCDKIFRRHSRTYYYSSRFFPPAVRARVCVLYAFFRLPDEAVDNPKTDPERELAAFRAAYEEEWHIGRSRHPVLRAFCNTAREFGIPKDWPDSFLDSMAMDLTVTRYPTYEDLRRYVYGSAEVVGLMMAQVLCVPDQGLPAAQELGLAMQLTNFYRDVSEDLDRGRIYIPLEDLERFGVREGEWNECIDPSKFEAVMTYQAERNREIYDSAHRGLRLIPRHSRLAVALSSTSYQRTLERIMHDPMVVWRTKIRRPKREYVPILREAWSAAYCRAPSSRTVAGG